MECMGEGDTAHGKIKSSWLATCADVELRVQCIAACADEGWHTVQYSFVMQLVWMKSSAVVFV